MSTALDAPVTCRVCGHAATVPSPACGRCGARLHDVATLSDVTTARSLLPATDPRPAGWPEPLVAAAPAVGATPGPGTAKVAVRASTAQVVIAHVVLWPGILLCLLVLSEASWASGYTDSSEYRFLASLPYVTLLVLPFLVACAVVSRGAGRRIAATGCVVAAALAAYLADTVSLLTASGVVSGALWTVYDIVLLVAWLVARRRRGWSWLVLVPAAALAVLWEFGIGPAGTVEESIFRYVNSAYASALLLNAPLFGLLGALGLIAAVISRASAAAGPPPGAPATFPAAPAAPAAPVGFGGPASPPPGSTTNTLAVVGFVLVWFVGVAGIVCGHVALGQIRRTGERGRGLAVATLVIGYSYLALVVVLVAVLLGVLASVNG